MTQRTAGVAVGAVRNAGAARGYLLLTLLLLTVPLTGCSAVIMHRYMAEAANRRYEL